MTAESTVYIVGTMRWNPATEREVVDVFRASAGKPKSLIRAAIRATFHPEALTDADRALIERAMEGRCP